MAKKEWRYTGTDGNGVYGVTEIMDRNLGWNKDALRSWAVFVTSQGGDVEIIRKEATEKGSRFHKHVEDFCNGIEPTFDPLDEKDEKSFLAWKEWILSLDIRVRAVEKKLIHRDEITGIEYGGTIDMVADVDGIPAVVDWKTTSSKKSEVTQTHKVQVAAYATMWNAWARAEYETREDMPPCAPRALVALVNLDTCEVQQVEEVPEHELTKYERAWQAILSLEKLKREG